MSDFEENDDFMCDDEEDYGLVSFFFSLFESNQKLLTLKTIESIH